MREWGRKEERGMEKEGGRSGSKRERVRAIESMEAGERDG